MKKLTSAVAIMVMIGLISGCQSKPAKEVVNSEVDVNYNEAKGDVLDDKVTEDIYKYSEYVGDVESRIYASLGYIDLMIYENKDVEDMEEHLLELNNTISEYLSYENTSNITKDVDKHFKNAMKELSNIIENFDELEDKTLSEVYSNLPDVLKADSLLESLTDNLNER